MSDIESLKACPWCGTNEHLHISKCGSRTDDMPDRPYRVICDHIDHDQIQGPVAYGKYAAIDAWNTRTPDPKLAEAERASMAGVWKQARDNHARYSATGSLEDDIRFFGSGLAGEAGEALEAAVLVSIASGKVANLVKKRWRDGDAHCDDLRKECADVFAYNIMLADALGMSPADLIEMVAFKQQVFVEKMEARPATLREEEPLPAKQGE